MALIQALAQTKEIQERFNWARVVALTTHNSDADRPLRLNFPKGQHFRSGARCLAAFRYQKFIVGVRMKGGSAEFRSYAVHIEWLICSRSGARQCQELTQAPDEFHPSGLD